MNKHRHHMVRTGAEVRNQLLGFSNELRRPVQIAIRYEVLSGHKTRCVPELKDRFRQPSSSAGYA